jgi:cytosine permease
MEKEKKSGVVEQYALSEIPKSERKSWLSIALIWAGAMICVPSLMLGGSLVSGLPLWIAILAGIVGYTIVVIYMTFQGMQGTDLGRPTVVSASSAFGQTGSRVVISLVLGVSIIGWFGVQCGVTGTAFSAIMAGMGVDFPVWLGSLIWGIIMLSTAIIGYKALEYLNYIAVPALVIIIVWGVIAALNNFGIDALTKMQPAAPFDFLQGVAMSVGGFAVGGVIAADYSRYAKSRKGSAVSTIVGVWPLGVLLIVGGAIMSAVAGTYDMTAVLAKLGVPVIGLIVLILATWTTNTVNAYSGGLALTNMFGLKDNKRALTTAIAGIIGTVLAVVGILNFFVPFLMILTAGITPIAGVMIADYWIVKRGKPERWAPAKGVRWTAIIAWLAGGVVGYFVTWGISAINAIVVALVLYLVLDAIFASKSKTAEKAANVQE